jgi:hypothetical protein
VVDIDVSKTLEELDGNDWGAPTYGSRLVIECHRLRRVPLHDFTVRDLCTMIGQDIGSRFLVPVALSHLAVDALVDRDFYPGSLIQAVLMLPGQFWTDHPRLRQQTAAVISTALGDVDTVVGSAGEGILDHTVQAMRRFLANRS